MEIETAIAQTTEAYADLSRDKVGALMVFERKNLLDDDFVVCGYIRKSDHMTSIVLGQYDGPALVYKGHVTLGVSGEDFRRIEAHNTVAAPAMEVPAGHGNEQAEWITPDLVCTVKFMERTANGGMRQPVFKGLRDDKAAHECKVVK